MKKPKLIVRPYRHSETHKWCLDLRSLDKGRQFFRHKSDADAERRRQLTTLERHGREAVGLSQRELSDFITAKRELAKYAKTINDAAKFLIDHMERVLKHGTTVSEFADKVLQLKRQAKRSDAHLAGLEMYFRKFCEAFGERPIASITTEELDDWLSALPANRANTRRNLSILFGAAVKRGIIPTNPMTRTEKPAKSDKAPEIFSPDELEALLETAQRIEPGIVPLLAIGAFAGLRSDVKDSEIARLEWSEVNQQRGFIEVKAAKAKTAQRRLVPIQPNLAKWLRPYAAMSGVVLPKNARTKRERVCKVAGVTWKRNGLRHSFASYHLAATNEAPKVATELGHPNPTLLYNTYRELVLPEDAERYWKIEPKDTAENVVAFSAKPSAASAY